MHRGPARKARGGKQADTEEEEEKAKIRRSLHPHGPAEQDQRVVGTQSASAKRVRQNDPGD